MKISVIGTGYVGLVAGACFAEIGHEVICVDNDQAKIENLKKGILPIYEPGLKQLVEKNYKEKRLSFTTDIDSAIKKSTVIFSAVGTPPDPEADHRADLSAVKAVAKTIGKHGNGYKIIVTKSTVPVGTGDLVKQLIADNQEIPFEYSIVSNPEFLREGNAIKDFMQPDRIVVGTNDEKSALIMKDLYKPITDQGYHLMLTDLHSAEVIKYAANSFLATKISFINEIANFCEKVGADINEVADGIGFDKRIGRHFLNAGIGYGGSCFPKDVRALIQTGKDFDHDFRLLRAVEEVNDTQKSILLDKLLQIHPELDGKTISIWGLSFKPDTDDIREAPSLVIMKKLRERNAKIKAFDPISAPLAQAHFPEDQEVIFTQDPYEALIDSFALLILTEWNHFKEVDFQKIKEFMREPHIFDGRNIHHPKHIKPHGINYYSIGRGDIRY